MTNRAWKLSASALAVAAGCGLATGAAANDDVLANIAAGNLVTPGIDYNLWNLSNFDQITPANVGQLTMQWTLSMGVLEEFEAPPLVVGNTMYIVAPVNEPDGVNQGAFVIALDLSRDGYILWEFRPDVDREGALTACCGDQTRGIHYAEGKIFFHTLDGQAFALDAETGEPLWRAVGADVTIREHAAGNGLVIGNLYIIGNEGGESGVRGKVSAFDINDGQTQWVMYNMGPNNEVGIGPRFNPQYAYMQMDNPALDTWFGDSWRRGGGTSWSYMSADTERNMFYYGTGNCGPWNPDYRREWGVLNLDENGNMVDYFNNFCASTMARDATTGELIWAANQVPADPWDLDMTTPHILIEFNGQDAVLNASRNGWVMVWDRETGEMLREPFVHTFSDVILGYNMESGLPIYSYENWTFTNREDRERYTAFQMPGAEARDDYTGTEVEVCPGTDARNWTLDTWNPQLNMVYSATNTSCSTQVVFEGEYVAGEGYTLNRGAGAASKGNRWFGEGVPMNGTQYTWEQLWNAPTTDISSMLQANDIVAGRTVWTVDFYGANNRASIMGTANGLIFQGSRATGALHAYDAATGEELWNFKTGTGFSGSPITYMLDGRQYVAVIGSTRSNPSVNPNTAEVAEGRFNRGGATLYVFALPTAVAGN
jgi:PQQ-dependent dehydrogenase (methanol/ethanol family)